MIAATVLGSGIAALDATVVGIALPTIGRAFHSGVGTLQWVVSGYSLTLAAFLLLGGSLGDRLGRKRIFSIGVVWFAVASMCCGIAPNAGVLIVARVLQGVGGALLAPASLAILQASFRPEDRVPGHRRLVRARRRGHRRRSPPGRVPDHRRVVAVGVLHQRPGGGRRARDHARATCPSRAIPRRRATSTSSGPAWRCCSWPGSPTASSRRPSHGWTSPAVLASLLVAALTGPVFLLVEHASAHPMLPLGVFRTRQFSGANAVTFIVYGALGGALFLLPVELQLVAQLQPARSRGWPCCR